MNGFLDRIRQFDWSVLQGEGLTVQGINFAHPLVLLLLVLLPAVVVVAPAQPSAAGCDSVPAHRPSGARTASAARLDARAAVVAHARCHRVHRGGGTAALRRTVDARGKRRHRHCAGGRHLQLDARGGFPAAESHGGGEGKTQAVCARAEVRSRGTHRVFRRGAHPGAAHHRLSGVARGHRQPAGGTARGWDGHRHRHRDGREPSAHGAREIACAHPDDRRREQSRRHRSAHGGPGGCGRSAFASTPSAWAAKAWRRCRSGEACSDCATKTGR